MRALMIGQITHRREPAPNRCANPHRIGPGSRRLAFHRYR